LAVGVQLKGRSTMRTRLVKYSFRFVVAMVLLVVFGSGACSSKGAGGGG
jgi:hypothetical protein